MLDYGRLPQQTLIEGVIDITLYKVLFMHYIMFLKSNSESQSTPDPRVSDERLYTCISNSNNILWQNRRIVSVQITAKNQLGLKKLHIIENPTKESVFISLSRSPKAGNQD